MVTMPDVMRRPRKDAEAAVRAAGVRGEIHLLGDTIIIALAKARVRPHRKPTATAARSRPRARPGTKSWE
jgi:hypothetical protein